MLGMEICICVPYLIEIR